MKAGAVPPHDLERIFELNPEAGTTVEIVRAGDARYPIVVLDNFYKRPHAVRDVALGLDYSNRRGQYPGFEARAPADTRDLFERVATLHDRLYPEPLRLHPSLRSPGFLFSIVTSRPADFTGVQRVPHTDSGRLAGLVYLNLPGQCAGGTAIYRHTETGLAWLPCNNPAAREADRIERMSRMIDGGAGWRLIREAMARHRCPTLLQLALFVYRDTDEQQMPITATTERWERLHLIEMKFNRFVLYPGSLFHSIVFGDAPFGEHIETRRLTQNLFVPWPPTAAC